MAILVTVQFVLSGQTLALTPTPTLLLTATPTLTLPLSLPPTPTLFLPLTPKPSLPLTRFVLFDGLRALLAVSKVTLAVAVAVALT